MMTALPGHPVKAVALDSGGYAVTLRCHVPYRTRAHAAIIVNARPGPGSSRPFAYVNRPGLA